MSDTCTHYEWSYIADDGEQWMDDSVEAVPSGVTRRWCVECGELWFRDSTSVGWHQKFWTQEEIDDIAARAAKVFL